MIVQDLPDGRLWCINQTAHTQMSADFCRNWGNADFAPLVAEGPTLTAVSQHDNGWWEWERAPEIGPDGRPLDFLTGPDWRTRLEQWERGVQRCFDQHPYAGVLTGQHGAALYERYLASVGAQGEEREALEQFIASRAAVIDHARTLLPGFPGLDDAGLTANTLIVQFADLAALMVTVPWPSGRSATVPVDHRGQSAQLKLTYDDSVIGIDPWPYSVPTLTVSVWGRVLDQPSFASDAAYRAALAQAEPYWRQWTVTAGSS